MGVGRKDARVAEFAPRDVVAFGNREDVGDDVLCPVAALEQHGFRPHFQQARSLFAHLCGAAGFGFVVAQQECCFRQVGGDDAGLRQQNRAHRIDGVFCQQSVPGCGDHDGVDHKESQTASRGVVGCCLHEFGCAEHAGLGGINVDVVDNRIELVDHEVVVDFVDAADPVGVLCDEGGDDAGPVGAARGEGFEVRLDSRTAGGVSAGDRDGDGRTRAGCGHEFSPV